MKAEESAMFNNLGNDLVHAWRGLLRWPFYPIVTVLMLGLAACANMTAFGVFYGYLLKPLPYGDPSRLVLMSLENPKINQNYPEVSAKIYAAVTASLKSFTATGLWSYEGPTASEINGQAREVDAVKVTPSFFTTLGGRPILGRLPSALSGTPDGPHEAVISENFWKAMFGGAPTTIGQRITVQGVDYQIVGVMPARFGFVDDIDLWGSFSPPVSGIPARNVNNFMPLLLAPNVTLPQFNAQLAQVLANIESHDSPADASVMRQNGETLVAEPMRGALLGLEDLGGLPAILQAMTALLLVLAVANAGNLALVRNRGRLSEFALRRVLGASRLGLLRFFLLEHLPIFGLAGMLGSGFGFLALRWLDGFKSTFDNPPFGIATGWPVYACCWASAAAAAGLIILVPAIQIFVQNLGDRLEQTAKATLTPAARRTQNLLGALQIGLAITLLIGSGALSLSLHRILTQPMGFDPDNRLVASVLIPPNMQSMTTLLDGVAAVSRLPGAVAATGTIEWSYPLTESLVELGIFPDRPAAQAEAVYFVPFVGDVFKTLGIPIEAGHNFDAAAQAGNCEKNLVISRNLAEASYGGRAAIGNMLKLSETDYKIIGITPPVLWQPLTDDGISGVMFYPGACMTTLPAPPPFHGATIIAHVTGSQARASTSIRKAIQQAIPGAAVTSIRPYAQVIFASIAFRALIADLVAAFAALAVILAALGVYAVNAYIARARLPEFGMRAMLGASPGRLFQVALTDTMRLIAFGVVGGIAGGYLLIRAMSSALFEVGDVMPLIFVLAVLAIAVVALAASWRPAAKAARMPVKRLLESA